MMQREQTPVTVDWEAETDGPLAPISRQDPRDLVARDYRAIPLPRHDLSAIAALALAGCLFFLSIATAIIQVRSLAAKVEPVPAPMPAPMVEQAPAEAADDPSLLTIILSCLAIAGLWRLLIRGRSTSVEPTEGCQCSRARVSVKVDFE